MHSRIDPDTLASIEPFLFYFLLRFEANTVGSVMSFGFALTEQSENTSKANVRVRPFSILSSTSFHPFLAHADTNKPSIFGADFRAFDIQIIKGPKTFLCLNYYIVLYGVKMRT